MDYYYYYLVYDQYFKQSLTQLSLHKLWQEEKLNVDLRRQVLVRNTLLTNNCLWILQKDHYNNIIDNENGRMQEETWLDACINDLEEEEQEKLNEQQLNIKNDLFYINNQHHHDNNNNNNNNKLNHQQKQKQQKSMILIKKEYQPNQHQETIKNDNTCWRWQL